jgi:hypothetical protein
LFSTTLTHHLTLFSTTLTHHLTLFSTTLTHHLTLFSWQFFFSPTRKMEVHEMITTIRRLRAHGDHLDKARFQPDRFATSIRRRLLPIHQLVTSSVPALRTWHTAAVYPSPSPAPCQGRIGYQW